MSLPANTLFLSRKNGWVSHPSEDIAFVKYEGGRDIIQWQEPEISYSDGKILQITHNPHLCFAASPNRRIPVYKYDNLNKEYFRSHQTMKAIARSRKKRTSCSGSVIVSTSGMQSGEADPTKLLIIFLAMQSERYLGNNLFIFEKKIMNRFPEIMECPDVKLNISNHDEDYYIEVNLDDLYEEITKASHYQIESVYLRMKSKSRRKFFVNTVFHDIYQIFAVFSKALVRADIGQCAIRVDTNSIAMRTKRENDSVIEYTGERIHIKGHPICNYKNRISVM